ncbi:MAG: FAD-binding protein, partial [Akkermansia sp.]|nr:FAD-binding protein [Akkermansia sp.]
MITELDIHLPLARALREDARRKAAAQKLQISPHRIKGMRLVKESIDARRRPICKQLRLLVGVDEELPPAALPERHYTPVAAEAKKVIIVGSGPGGLFAALRCIELGMRPVVLERGKDVSARRFDLQPINCKGYVVEDSNYCFGEGGAGTFSDGKLFTRATKRGPVMEIYETFVAHGAAPEILTDAHPHIGSNRLP